MHALALEGVQIDRQGRDERLAFAGLHLGDLAAVEDHAADHLDVEVAHPEDAARPLAHDGERLRQQIVELLAFREALAERARHGAERVVRERLEARLELVDLVDQRPEAFQLAVVLRADDLPHDGLQHQPITITYATNSRKAGLVPPRRE